MPGGHILALAWETLERDEALRLGRRGGTTSEAGLWPDWVVEIEPIRPKGARVVWEWHARDHFVQSEDPVRPDYGQPADHPDRIDLNGFSAAPPIDPDQLAQLQAIGYVPADADPSADESRRDFLHINSVAYNEDLDQIALSVPTFGEIWIIDHDTTTAEAAGSSGGRAGRGGDLIYRWGNPAAYGRGTPEEKRLFYQHDVRWIPAGTQGVGRLMIFNNGDGRQDGSYSSIDEIDPPLDANGRYRLADGAPFGPSELAASYSERDRFFSPFISGAHRLPNGNTMICQGISGRLFEIAPDGRVVWDYLVPYGGTVRNKDGSMPQPGLDDSPHAVFRATRIPADHPGLKGRQLVPLDPQPPVHVAKQGAEADA
jgi:hypothetical protein